MSPDLPPCITGTYTDVPALVWEAWSNVPLAASALRRRILRHMFTLSSDVWGYDVADTIRTGRVRPVLAIPTLALFDPELLTLPVRSSSSD